jgi:hypothetical protein
VGGKPASCLGACPGLGLRGNPPSGVCNLYMFRLLSDLIQRVPIPCSVSACNMAASCQQAFPSLLVWHCFCCCVNGKHYVCYLFPCARSLYQLLICSLSAVLVQDVGLVEADGCWPA